MQAALSPAEERELYRMVKEIYHHLNLDGRKIVNMTEKREEIRKEVLKRTEKWLKKEHVSETS